MSGMVAGVRSPSPAAGETEVGSRLRGVLKLLAIGTVDLLAPAAIIRLPYARKRLLNGDEGKWVW